MESTVLSSLLKYVHSTLCVFESNEKVVHVPEYKILSTMSIIYNGKHEIIFASGGLQITTMNNFLIQLLDIISHKQLIKNLNDLDLRYKYFLKFYTNNRYNLVNMATIFYMSFKEIFSEMT